MYIYIYYIHKYILILHVHTHIYRYNGLTGVYAGTVSTQAGGVAYPGEWIELTYNIPYTVGYFFVRPIADSRFFIAWSPRLFQLFGSNDAVNWDIVYKSPNITNWLTSGRKYFGLTNAVTYTSYRLVTERVGNNDISTGKESYQ